jgi:hypothetical protein
LDLIAEDLTSSPEIPIVYDGGVDIAPGEPITPSDDPTDVDASQFDYPWPPTDKSVIGLQHPSTADVECPFGYRSLQE